SVNRHRRACLLVAQQSSIHFKAFRPVGSDSSHTRDSAWRRRAFGAVPFQATTNFLKILNFQFTLNSPLDPR
ncbi:hypothetical protein, partial [Lunatimonas lonarensis]|uniref:hypothetical protein n=1 Tax=Lunatimonas lonarensis TaxID=1232681 RepID=UPI001EE359FB